MAANEQMTPEFCNLGRLEAHEAEVEPARRAAALRADDRHEDQQADGHSQDQERQLLIPFICTRLMSHITPMPITAKMS